MPRRQVKLVRNTTLFFRAFKKCCLRLDDGNEFSLSVSGVYCVKFLLDHHSLCGRKVSLHSARGKKKIRSLFTSLDMEENVPFLCRIDVNTYNWNPKQGSRVQNLIAFCHPSNNHCYLIQTQVFRNMMHCQLVPTFRRGLLPPSSGWKN